MLTRGCVQVSRLHEAVGGRLPVPRLRAVRQVLDVHGRPGQEVALPGRPRVPPRQGGGRGPLRSEASVQQCYQRYELIFTIF